MYPMRTSCTQVAGALASDVLKQTEQGTLMVLGSGAHHRLGLTAEVVGRWSSVYECQSVECAFTSPVIIELGMLVMYCMQFVMSVSVVSWCGVAVFLGAMYMLSMVMSLKCIVCIFRSCVVRVDGLWRLDVRECCV